MKNRWYLKIALIPIGILLLTYVVMQLWNNIVPDLFHGPILNYWQTIGVLVLAKVLFGGFHRGWGGGCCGHGGKWGHHRGGWWKQRLEDKMAKKIGRAHV